MRKTAIRRATRTAQGRVLAGLGIIAGGLAVVTPVARAAAGPLTVTVTTAPASVSSGQKVTYTLTATNSGSAPATGVTLASSVTTGQDALVPPISLAGGLASQSGTTSAGSCGTDSTTGQVACSLPSLAAGQAWTVAISGTATSQPGTILTENATVSGTESSTPFTATAAGSANVILPAGFVQTQLAHGLSKPTAIAFAPNGDIYIGTQGGGVYIYRNGAILPTPVLTITNIDAAGEKGLLGLALDPNFATNGYMYVSYTALVTNSAGLTQSFAQLSRFTVVNGVASTSGEKVYARGNQLQNLHHSANDVKIGPDGKLWWSVGDNVPSISNARTLENIYGKILRFNLDGTIPADNPFVNVPNAVPAIYAYGLRNPFRFSFLPTGQAITEDTGSSYWEELDAIQPGGNYGWDIYEGVCGSCGAINPAYVYGHLPADGAASAVAAYTGTAFPSQYAHTVFVGDYNRRDISAVSFDPGYQTETSDTVFDSAAGTIADLEVGPDGNLYYVSIFEGTFTKVSAPGPFTPVASAAATPTGGMAPLAVQFSSAGSADPHGAPLSYSWNFGDGSPVNTTPNPSHVYTANGTYTATLTVTNGAQTTGASTRVVVGQTSASILAPSSYNAGATVAFSGSATDATDGTLPASAYSWKVDFISNGAVQPSYTDEVAHPFYSVSGVTGASFQIPTDPSQTATSFYRITLTVTDSLGVQTTVTQDLHPHLTTWTANSNVAGAGYWVDGTWHTGPYTAQDVVGVHHVVSGVALEQVISGTTYRFNGWADGSALTDTFTTGPSAASYTGNYDSIGSSLPAPWQSVDIGSPLDAGRADHAAATNTFYVDGSGADVNGSNDQSHYVYQTLNGDGTIVARVRYQTNSDAWAKAGVMIRQSATGGSPWVDALATPDVSPNTPNLNCVGYTADGCDAPLPPVIPSQGYGDRMQYYSTGSKTPATNPPANVSPNKWVKLQKAGNTFTSWLSTDGVNWTQIGIATVTMTNPVTVGLFVTSHDIGQLSSVAFDNVQVTGTQPPPPPGPLPSPWIDTDVGSPAIAGSAGYTNGVLTINGSGTDIYGTNDQFNYVYQPVSAGGTIVARVTSQTNTSSNAKAGVMFKQSTTAGTNYILIAVAPSGVVKVQYDFNGSLTESTYTFPNVWMKLSYSAGKFNAWLSSDGVNWTAALTGKTLPINDPMTVGLFECSHNASALGTATFDNVSFTPGN